MEVRYSSTITSLTRDSPRVDTRRYLRVKFKNFPWKSRFHDTWSTTRRGVCTTRHEVPRDVKCYEMLSATRREEPRDVKYHETSHVHGDRSRLDLWLSTNKSTTVAYNDV